MILSGKIALPTFASGLKFYWLIITGSIQTYLLSLSSLSDDDIRFKLAILKAPNEELQYEPILRNVQSLTATDLFRQVEYSSRLNVSGVSPSALFAGPSMTGPQSPLHSTPAPAASGVSRLIDLSLVRSAMQICFRLWWSETHHCSLFINVSNTNSKPSSQTLTAI